MERQVVGHKPVIGGGEGGMRSFRKFREFLNTSWTLQALSLSHLEKDALAPNCYFPRNTVPNELVPRLVQYRYSTKATAQ